MGGNQQVCPSAPALHALLPLSPCPFALLSLGPRCLLHPTPPSAPIPPHTPTSASAPTPPHPCPHTLTRTIPHPCPFPTCCNLLPLPFSLPLPLPLPYYADCCYCIRTPASDQHCNSTITSSWSLSIRVGVCIQEVGAFAADPSPTTTTHTPPTCSPNLGGSVADPDYDNPSFSIMNPSDLSQSPSLTLALLLEAWPVNSYPYVVQLPTGSVFVAAGRHPTSCPCLCQHMCVCACMCCLQICSAASRSRGSRYDA